jgi:hypothetical protein
MSTPVIQDLIQRIQEQEAELAKLRQELESRQTTLSKLRERKEELETQLQQIDAEIASVGEISTPKAAPAPVPSKATALPLPTVKPDTSSSFPMYLVNLVEQANRPITVKELAEAVIENKYPTNSKNLQGMIQTRVYDLVSKGFLKRRADGGLVLGKAAAKTSNGAPQAVPKKAAVSRPAKPVEAKKKQPLREALIDVLAESSHPLSAQELADQIVANGYKSKSKDLKNVIWVGIGKIKEIERVEGKGYRLKKGKGLAAGKKG